LLDAVQQLKQQQRSIRADQKRAARLSALSREIDQLTVRLEDIERQLKAAPTHDSRLALLIASGAARLNTSRKAFFDIIRMTCCNIFLAAADLFRQGDRIQEAPARSMPPPASHTESPRRTERAKEDSFPFLTSQNPVPGCRLSSPKTYK